MDFKKNFRTIEIVSINPLSSFTMGVCLSVVLSIVLLLVLDSFDMISLRSLEIEYIPQGIFNKYEFLKNFQNPFTLSLLMGIPLGIGGGLVFLILSLLYNLFSSAAGGIKFICKD